jgi:MarR family transcriptional regulator for hemolysin
MDFSKAGLPGEVVGRTVAFAGKLVSARFEETLARAGGTVPTWLILFTLNERGAVSQRELAECIHLESATVTYHLDRLDAAGLITRHRDENDRRVWRASVTPAGVEVFDRMREAALRFETALRADLSERDLAHFFKTLDRVSASASAFDPGAEISSPPSPRTPERST